jgi:hypothetical protein
VSTTTASPVFVFKLRPRMESILYQDKRLCIAALSIFPLLIVRTRYGELPLRTELSPPDLPVDRYRDHRWGFPCCVWSPMRTCYRHYPGRLDGACSLVYLHRTAAFPVKKSGRLLQLFFPGPAQRSLTLWPARSPSRQATLYTEGSNSFVASAVASIATGWSEPVPGREFHPL